MQDQNECEPSTPKGGLPWNKGELTGAKAAAATQARLVDPDEASRNGSTKEKRAARQILN